MTRYFITGGTGSLGSALMTHLLQQPETERLACFSRDEVKQGDLAARLGPDTRLRFFLGDVRSRDRLLWAMDGCDTVIHAAALKRVDQVAYNPTEVIETNILGTRHVIDAAIAVGVQRVLLISSDKAVYPINIYGTSKLAAEHLTVHANTYGHPRGTMMSVVRYGNVMGSRGSVVQGWRAALKLGARLPLTDPAMTRFWLTINDAVALILRVLPIMHGGEVFVPMLPTLRLIDLAFAIAAEYGMSADKIKWDLTGRRPGGEKIDETLLTEEEVTRTVVRLKEVVYLVTPSHRTWSTTPYEGEPVDPGLVYQSDTHPWRLTIEEIRALLRELP